MENNDTIFPEMYPDETEVSRIQGFLTRLIDFAVVYFYLIPALQVYTPGYIYQINKRKIIHALTFCYYSNSGISFRFFTAFQ